MEKYRFIDYEKISDELCFLGYKAILKMNVNLAYKDKLGRRVSYHSEVQYPSYKYGKRMDLINIKRRFSFYLTIENIEKDSNGVKGYIMITPRDIIDLRMKLNQVFAWFTDERYKDLYALNHEHNLIICKKVDTIKVIRLAMNKYLEFEPIVYKTDKVHSMGLRIYLSSDSNYIEMSIDDFMEFKYFIDSINMYQSALLMLNYLQRPSYGSNMYTFQDDNLNEINETQLNKSYQQKERMINPSVYNKIENM